MVFPSFGMWFSALAHSLPPPQLHISLGSRYTITSSSFILRTKGGTSFPLLVMSGCFSTLYWFSSPSQHFGSLLSYLTWLFSCWDFDRYKSEVTLLGSHCELVADLVNLYPGLLIFLSSALCDIPGCLISFRKLLGQRYWDLSRPECMFIWTGQASATVHGTRVLQGGIYSEESCLLHLQIVF